MRRGRVFGLGFTMERLHRDLSDLADRIDEIATGQNRGEHRSLAWQDGLTAVRRAAMVRRLDRCLRERP